MGRVYGRIGSWKWSRVFYKLPQRKLLQEFARSSWSQFGSSRFCNPTWFRSSYLYSLRRLSSQKEKDLLTLFWYFITIVCLENSKHFGAQVYYTYYPVNLSSSFLSIQLVSETFLMSIVGWVCSHFFSRCSIWWWEFFFVSPHKATGNSFKKYNNVAIGWKKILYRLCRYCLKGGGWYEVRGGEGISEYWLTQPLDSFSPQK